MGLLYHLGLYTYPLSACENRSRHTKRLAGRRRSIWSPVHSHPVIVPLYSCSSFAISRRHAQSRAGLIGIITPRRPVPGVDRKSTRLNSSHLGISYAVFCL